MRSNFEGTNGILKGNILCTLHGTYFKFSAWRGGGDMFIDGKSSDLRDSLEHADYGVINGCIRMVEFHAYNGRHFAGREGGEFIS